MTDLMAEDLGLAVNAARAELRIPVIVAPAAQQALRLASSHGLGRKDFTAIYTFPQAVESATCLRLSWGLERAPRPRLRRRAPAEPGRPLSHARWVVGLRARPCGQRSGVRAWQLVALSVVTSRAFRAVSFAACWTS